MGEHKCNSCFYMQNERSRSPCNVCEGYNKYVNRNIYIQRPDTIEIKTWTDNDYFDEYEKERYIEVVDTDEDFDDYGGGSTLDDYPEFKQDNVNSPKHYTAGKYEVIEVIEDWDLNFRLANTVKYIARHKHKGKPLEDLEKALWYLQREVDQWKLLSKN